MMPDADEIDPVEAEALTRRLVDEIGAMVYGKGQAVQGSVLANLLALYLVGWPRQNRTEILASMLEAVAKLSPHYELLAHGPAGHPSNDGRD